jgi:myo-inositol-1-phosphate synthase
MAQIKVAIAGVGNCASNFIQGIEYYKNNPESDLGLMHRKAGNYDITDIKVVAAFDIAEGKVGKDISEAIYAYPNCTENVATVSPTGVIVKKGPVLDGWDEHLGEYVTLSKESEVDIKQELIDSEAEILVVILPTGSKKACLKYVTEALSAGVSVVNGIPVFVSQRSEVTQMALDNKAAIVGDDFKSQIGGTIFHHTLLNLLKIRGVQVDKSYHINYAGNMDFWNLTTDRGQDKHRSKANGIKAGGNGDVDLSVNVTYLENQGDNKTCRVYIEGKNFSGCPVTLEGKLTVVDSANSSGVLVDLIRCLKIAKEKKIYGYLEEPSAYYMKSPKVQMLEEIAYEKICKFMEE